MAVLKEQESEPEEEQEEAEENDDAEEQEQEQDQEQEQEQEQEKAHIHQHQDEAYDEVPARPTMQISAPGGNATALPVPKQPSSDGENGNSGENGGGNEIGNPLPNTIYVRGSEQSSVWHFAYGWWLPANIVNRLCSSLAQIQPEQFKFTASKNGISPLPTDVTTDTLPPRIYQPDGTTRTIIAPLRIKASNHWILATLCPSEKVISVYNPLPNSSLSHAEVTAALDGVLVNVLSEDDAFAVADCAVVPRSCPAQTSSIDSGVAVIALSLYCLVGRSIPQHTNSWLWRRMLAFYLTRLSPGDPAQTAKDSAMATLFAKTLSGHQVDAPADATTSAATAAADSATRTETEKNTTNRIQPRPFVEHSALAQRDSVIEGRAVWMAAAQLASRAEADARRKRDDIVSEMKHVVDALFHHESESETGSYPRRGDARTSLEGDGSTLAKSVRRLEMAVKKAEAEMAGIAVVVNGIHVVLKDLDTIIPITISKSQD